MHWLSNLLYITADHFKFSFFYCHMLNDYSEAVIGDEILNSQAPSNNVQTICLKKTHTSKKESKKNLIYIVQKLKYRSKIEYIYKIKYCGRLVYSK